MKTVAQRPVILCLRPRNLKILLSAIFFLMVQSAQAKIVAGAVSAGLGNAGVGALEITDGIINNPAMISAYPSEHLGITTTEGQQQIFFADNGADALFPAALGYSQEKFVGDIERKDFHLTLGYSIPVQKNKLFLGADFQYRQWKLNKTEQNYPQTVANIGAFYQFLDLPWLSVGTAIEGVPLTDTQLANSVDRATKSFLGFGFGSATFARFRLDVGNTSNQSNSNLIFRGGLQTAINDWILTSVGYENDNVIGSKTLTIGIGFKGPQFGLYYAYQEEANDLFEARHVVDLSVPF